MTFHIKLELVQNRMDGQMDRWTDGFIRIHDGTRYLTLFGFGKMVLFTRELDIL